MKSEVYSRKVDTWNELLDRIKDDIARIKERLVEQHAMFSHELQSALILTVEFSKIYYKLTDFALEQQMLETLRNISFLSIIWQLYIQIALSRKPF
jgi:hypothetical protein